MARPLEYERTDAGGRAASELQDRLVEHLAQFSSNPLICGSLVEDVEITAGTPKEVEHLLGSAPEGFLVVRRSADATVFESGTWDSNKITLDAGANVTVSLWVF